MGRVLLCGWGGWVRRCSTAHTLSWLLVPLPQVLRTLLNPFREMGPSSLFASKPPLFIALLKKWALGTTVPFSSWQMNQSVASLGGNRLTRADLSNADKSCGVLDFKLISVSECVCVMQLLECPDA